MKNYVQPGNVVTATAPTGGVLSGGGMLLGTLFGVATVNAGQGAPVEIATTGVFDLPKAAGDTFAAGAKAYWSATSGNTTATATSNTFIGTVLAAAAGADVTARIRLNGVSV